MGRPPFEVAVPLGESGGAGYCELVVVGHRVVSSLCGPAEHSGRWYPFFAVDNLTNPLKKPVTLTVEQGIRRAQELVRIYIPEGHQLSEELIAERRDEALRE